MLRVTSDSTSSARARSLNVRRSPRGVRRISSPMRAALQNPPPSAVAAALCESDRVGEGYRTRTEVTEPLPTLAEEVRLPIPRCDRRQSPDGFVQAHPDL